MRFFDKFPKIMSQVEREAWAMPQDQLSTDGVNLSHPRADRLTPWRVECFGTLIADPLTTRDLMRPHSTVEVPLVQPGFATFLAMGPGAGSLDGASRAGAEEGWRGAHRDKASPRGAVDGRSPRAGAACSRGNSGRGEAAHVGRSALLEVCFGEESSGVLRTSGESLLYQRLRSKGDGILPYLSSWSVQKTVRCLTKVKRSNCVGGKRRSS